MPSRQRGAPSEGLGGGQRLAPPEVVAEGITTIKVKIGVEVERDIAVVAAVRAAIGGAAKIRVDANQSYRTWREAVRAITAMEKYDLVYAEQPVEGLHPMAQVSARRHRQRAVLGRLAVRVQCRGGRLPQAPATRAARHREGRASQCRARLASLTLSGSPQENETNGSPITRPEYRRE
jgi:Enolase C-terminal domain-like